MGVSVCELLRVWGLCGLSQLARRGGRAIVPGCTISSRAS
jgi:hypothetical protein